MFSKQLNGTFRKVSIQHLTGSICQLKQFNTTQVVYGYLYVVCLVLVSWSGPAPQLALLVPLQAQVLPMPPEAGFAGPVVPGDVGWPRPEGCCVLLQLPHDLQSAG